MRGVGDGPEQLCHAVPVPLGTMADRLVTGWVECLFVFAGLPSSRQLSPRTYSLTPSLTHLPTLCPSRRPHLLPPTRHGPQHAARRLTHAELTSAPHLATCAIRGLAFDEAAGGLRMAGYWPSCAVMVPIAWMEHLCVVHGPSEIHSRSQYRQTD